MVAQSGGEVNRLLGRRKAFLAKWRLRCRGVADSLEEAGERLFTFPRLSAAAMEVLADHRQRIR